MTTSRNVCLQRKDNVRRLDSSSGTEIGGVYVQTARGVGVSDVAVKDRVFSFPVFFHYF